MPVKTVLKGSQHNFLDCAVAKNILEYIILDSKTEKKMYVCSE